VGSRIAYPSVSYLSRKVTSEVSVFRIPLSKQSKSAKDVLAKDFFEENFDAEGVTPF
jgi:hypothetical protein